MSAEFSINDTSKLDEDFSVIERLADAIRIEEDVKISKQDRDAMVQDLYEGPRKCQCCINWMDECPHDVDLTEITKDDDDNGSPLVIRRRVNPGESGTVVSIHSIEIRHAATRKVLVDVFKPYDDIVHEVKYLNFLAPFHQFFWRWERFEKAVADEKDDSVKRILAVLRGLVKRELADAFAVSKELISHGVITFNYLWTLFAPGDLIYSDDDTYDRFYVLENFTSRGETAVDLTLTYITWSWVSNAFGTNQEELTMREFRGTRPINSLPAFPAKYLKNLASMQLKLTERGRKYADLAGTHYKAYHPEGLDASTELRVMIDASHRRRFVSSFVGDSEDRMFPQWTDLINQSPVDSPPAGGHIPLEQWDDDFGPRRRGDTGFGRRPIPPPRRASPIRNYPPPPIIRQRSPMVEVTRRRRRSISVDSRIYDAASLEEARKELTDFHLQLTDPTVHGYDLKGKTWGTFSVDRIGDIEWNTKPFESLVLPDGFKELILAFVESQIKDKVAFDDVINGKGGGLVALLAGDPGVGKTLTAESIAEKIQAPLYKLELGDYDEDDRDHSRDRSVSPRPRGGGGSEDFTTAFDLAARWGAVLLIDECDMYLEKRSEGSSKRNRMVSRFLKELEYYPSLLFLTTNRERSLDPAIYSRVHLTINYPALDKPSRLKIWRTFLEKNGSDMSDQELEALSMIEVNGRRIRNIVKTAGIMATRESRAIRFDDVKKVMKITEGLEIEGPN